MFGDLEYMAMAWSQMILAPVILVSVMLPIIIYVIARWRTYRDDSAPDPQLGLKVAICWFKIAAYHLLLSAGFILLYTIIADLPEYASKHMMRLGAGMALPAALIFAVHVFALKQTNSEQRPSVRRMFSGVSLMQSGLIAFSGLMLGGILLFQEDTPKELNRLALTMVLVYGTAWALQGASLLRDVTGAFMPTATIEDQEATSPQ